MAVKKWKPKKTEDHPPSRKWLIYQNERKLWEQMVHLHGTAIEDVEKHGGLSDLDKRLIKKFGRYKNDPTCGTFRCSDGTIIEGTDEGEEIDLFPHDPKPDGNR